MDELVVVSSIYDDIVINNQFFDLLSRNMTTSMSSNTVYQGILEKAPILADQFCGSLLGKLGEAYSSGL